MSHAHEQFFSADVLAAARREFFPAARREFFPAAAARKIVPESAAYGRWRRSLISTRKSVHQITTAGVYDEFVLDDNFIFATVRNR